MRTEWREYIRQKRHSLFSVGTGLLIFASVMVLYQVPGEAVAYGLLLSGAAEGLWLISGFGKFQKKQELLKGLADEERKEFYLRDLPEPEDPKEESYQELLETLIKEKNREQIQTAEKQKEMETYYTLWVHQIKTPIAAMSLLLQEEDTPEHAELSMELFRIEEYVGMVLQYLRLESPDQDLVFRLTDVDDCIRQAVRKYARSFIRKKLALDFQETGLQVVTDEKWLVFVLEQLLSNALKYTREGKIRIYAREGVLFIEDTGIGILPEDLPRIFEKGYTGYNGRRDKKSTGIGLSLCQEILKRLSHPISITSVPGKGTRVALDLTQQKQLYE